MPCTVGLIIRLPMHATTPLEVTECCLLDLSSLLDLSRGCVVVPMTEYVCQLYCLSQVSATIYYWKVTYLLTTETIFLLQVHLFPCFAMRAKEGN